MNSDTVIAVFANPPDDDNYYNRADHYSANSPPPLEEDLQRFVNWKNGNVGKDLLTNYHPATAASPAYGPSYNAAAIAAEERRLVRMKQLKHYWDTEVSRMGVHLAEEFLNFTEMPDGEIKMLDFNENTGYFDIVVTIPRPKSPVYSPVAEVRPQPSHQNGFPTMEDFIRVQGMHLATRSLSIFEKLHKPIKSLYDRVKKTGDSYEKVVANVFRYLGNTCLCQITEADGHVRYLYMARQFVNALQEAYCLRYKKYVKTPIESDYMFQNDNTMDFLIVNAFNKVGLHFRGYHHFFRDVDGVTNVESN